MSHCNWWIQGGRRICISHSLLLTLLLLTCSRVVYPLVCTLRTFSCRSSSCTHPHLHNHIWSDRWKEGNIRWQNGLIAWVSASGSYPSSHTHLYVPGRSIQWEFGWHLWGFTVEVHSLISERIELLNSRRSSLLTCAGRIRFSNRFVSMFACAIESSFLILTVSASCVTVVQSFRAISNRWKFIVADWFLNSYLRSHIPSWLVRYPALQMHLKPPWNVGWVWFFIVSNLVINASCSLLIGTSKLSSSIDSFLALIDIWIHKWAKTIRLFHRTITDWFSESILRCLLVERQAGTCVILDLGIKMITSGCTIKMTLTKGTQLENLLQV